MQPARCGGFARNYGSPPVLAPHLRALSGYVYFILCVFSDSIPQISLFDKTKNDFL